MKLFRSGVPDHRSKRGQHANIRNGKIKAQELVHMGDAAVDMAGDPLRHGYAVRAHIVEEHRAAKQHDPVAGQDAAEDAQAVHLYAEDVAQGQLQRSEP